MSTSLHIVNNRAEANESAAQDQTPDDLQHSTPTEDVPDKNKLRLPMGRKLDDDPDLQFQLRGHSQNPLIDAAHT